MKVLLALLPLVLAIYALVDCIQTDESRVRGLAKPWWMLIIVLVGVVGPVAWLVAGKERSGGRARPGIRRADRPRTRRLAPDDDPEFLASLRRADEEQQRMLRRWEEDLRRREQQERGDATPEPDGPDDRPPAKG